MTEPTQRSRNETSDEFVVECETAGNIVNDLTVGCHITLCGYIKDGVSFSFGRRGGWVLSFADLERIYRAAAKRRALPSESANLLPGLMAALEIAERYLPDNEAVRFLRNDIKDAILKNAAPQESISTGTPSGSTPAVAAPSSFDKERITACDQCGATAHHNSPCGFQFCPFAPSRSTNTQSESTRDRLVRDLIETKAPVQGDLAERLRAILRSDRQAKWLRSDEYEAIQQAALALSSTSVPEAQAISPVALAHSLGALVVEALQRNWSEVETIAKQIPIMLDREGAPVPVELRLPFSCTANVDPVKHMDMDESVISHAAWLEADDRTKGWYSIPLYAFPKEPA